MPKTLIGTFKKGLEISGVFHKEFELRESDTSDMLTAEMEVQYDKPLNYQAQLLAQTLVRVGDYEGPFNVSMIGRLSPRDFRLLQIKMQELEALGEVESSGNGTG